MPDVRARGQILFAYGVVLAMSIWRFAGRGAPLAGFVVLLTVAAILLMLEAVVSSRFFMQYAYLLLRCTAIGLLTDQLRIDLPWRILSRRVQMSTQAGAAAR